MFLLMNKSQTDILTKAEVGDGNILALPTPGIPKTQLFPSFSFNKLFLGTLSAVG